MNLHVDIEVKGNLLLAAASGTLSFDAALHEWKLVLDRASKDHANRILFDATALDGTLSTMDRYRLATDLSPLLVHDATIAVVGRPPAVDAFGALVAWNLGKLVLAFPTRPEALHWLDTARISQAKTRASQKRQARAAYRRPSTDDRTAKISLARRPARGSEDMPKSSVT